MTTVLRCAVLQICALVCALALSVSVAVAAAENTDVSKPGVTKPNVLLIVLDDAGYSDVAGFGRNDAPTPTLKKIADEGVRFTRHYADSTCRPARLALLTGRESARVAQNPDFRGISPEIITLPEALKAAGYSTHHVGKWHLGDAVREAWPDRQGFDSWFGFLNQFQLKGPDKSGSFSKRPTYTDPFLQGSTETLRQFSGHLEDILGERVSEKIRSLAQDKNTPWFINYWTFAPHHPTVAANTYLKKFPDTPAGKYQALLAQVDANIGRAVTALRETGQLDNTLIIVTSDNGGTNSMMNNNFPFAGVKAGFEEGSLRTPLVIRWPDKRYAGETRDAVVAIQDIYPTVLAATGIAPAAPVDGQALQPVLDGQALVPRLLVHEIALPGNYAFSLLTEDGAWRVTPEALFDLQAAPAGDRNSADVQQQRMASLQQRYLDWRAQKIRVPLNVIARSPQSPMLLTGDSFRRAPGYGAYSVAVGVRWPLPAATTLLSQASVWSLATDAKGLLQLAIDDSQATASALPIDLAKAGDCVPVVMTSYFSRSRLHAGKNTAHMHVYVGNQRVLAHAVHNPRELPGDLLAPMQVGEQGTLNTSGPATESASRLGVPLVFNAELPPSEQNPWGDYSVEQAGAEACSSMTGLPAAQTTGSSR